MSFKAYSERRKVRTSLLNVYKIAESEVDAYLAKDAETGKWGFHYEIDEEGALCPRVAQDEIVAETPQDVEPTIEVVEPAQDEKTPQDECFAEVAQDEISAEVVNPFGAFAFAQLTATHSLPVAPSEQKKKKVAQDDEVSSKIEKDRPEQNGIKRPSAGGKCREVWDTLDTMREATKRTPTSKEIKAHAQEKGWENVTTCIQYYQWRKFNGIKGRI